MNSGRPATTDGPAGEGLAAIPAQRMRRLLAQGAARPLLPDHDPVPVLFDHRWWHVPNTATHGPGNDSADDSADEPAYRLACAEQAALFTRLHAQYRAAHAGAGVTGAGETPPWPPG